MTTTQKAEVRVNLTPALQPFEDLLLRYDWPNAEEHAAWVATAPEAEIIAWAEQIRRDEEADPRTDAPD